MHNVRWEQKYEEQRWKNDSIFVTKIPDIVFLYLSSQHARLTALYCIVRASLHKFWVMGFICTSSDAFHHIAISFPLVH